MLNLHSSTAKSGGDDNLIPMINIIFLLLIFFMVAGQITLSADVVLPSSISESEMDASPRLLSLQADGILRLEGEVIEVNMLVSTLAGLELDAAAPLVAHVDASLPASALDPLMAAAESLNITSLTLVTEQTP
jgi:biopolymer transport protein ExbD